MPITDLLDRIPIPTRSAAETAAPTGDGVDSATEPQVTFEVEVPVVERAGIALPPAAPLPESVVPPALEGEAPDAAPEPAPSSPPAPSAPLPSWAVLVIGALALLCFALTVALVAATRPPAPAAADVAEAEPPAAAEPPSPATFAAEPAPIPVELITRLEEAGDEDLSVELSRLLDAIQHGFGRRSARLEPTLQSYVYRMASRFEWNPDSFRIAVTAPDADLAAARSTLLAGLFADAVAAGRLEIGVGIGPHALTLVSE